MNTRVKDLCRRLRPVLGKRVDGLWHAYIAETDGDAKTEIETTLELLAGKHLGCSYEPDRSPFPPPPKSFASAGDVPIGDVSYGPGTLYPFALPSARLKEHTVIGGRSGSGKSNLTFVLLEKIMRRGIKVLALDWKRGYRDLLALQPNLRVYTIGRDVAPFRFNPLIPPPGCEPGTWMKLIVDVIANAYLGGEGVISLLVAGLEYLYREAPSVGRWPTVVDLLAWLRQTKLRGRAAMWQASAERILVGLTYGEFGAVVKTNDNAHIRDLLDHNVIMEMDGLSSSSDRTMFSEALTLYLFRLRLAQGPRREITNLIVLEEAHHVLSRKAPEARESVLETSIRMIRQYGIGYVFIDQSASLMSRVAFANSYATIALSQKLRADVQTIVGAMNLTEEQRDALSTLPVGTAVVRLADEFPEPFLIKVPLSGVQEGSVTDVMIRRHMVTDSADSTVGQASTIERAAIPEIPVADKNESHFQYNIDRLPPTQPIPSIAIQGTIDTSPPEPTPTVSREALRFLADIIVHPHSGAVTRYERLRLSRRRGNAIRSDLVGCGAIEPVPIATRSGQIVLYELGDSGRDLCRAAGIEAAPPTGAGLEHTYWVARIAKQFERDGYAVEREHHIPGDGHVDLVAQRGGQCVAIEVETGKSDIPANLDKLGGAGFDRVIFLATSPAAAAACQRAMERHHGELSVELWTWLDVA